jgi:diguanylate cyclase
MTGREHRNGSHAPPRRRRWSRAAACVTLAAGAGASCVGGLWWHDYVRHQEATNFRDAARLAASALHASLERDGALSAAASAYIGTTPNLTSTQFSDWFNVLRSDGHFSGAFALAYVERVSSDGLASFRAETMANPPFGAAPSGTAGVIPAGSRGPYCLTRAGAAHISPTMHLSLAEISPLLSLAASNLNWCALPVWRDLLREASDRDEPAATTIAPLMATLPTIPGVPQAPRSLLTRLGRSGLIATVTPVYPTGKRPSLRATTGWVLSVYQAGKIVRPVLASHHGYTATLSYKNPGSGWIALYRSGGGTKGLKERLLLRTPGLWSVTLAAPGSSAGLSATSQGVAVLMAGLLVTLLLSFLGLVLLRSRARVLELVDARTAQLHHQARHDALTDLPNRTLIFDRVEQMLARARRDMTEIAVLFVDLDQFKDVNDTFGHAAGDDMLREASRRFRASVRETDTIGRLGGDEFVVLLEDAVGASDPEAVARRILHALEDPFTMANGQQTISFQGATIGIATGLRDSAEALLGDADIALYNASHNAFEVFRPEMRVSTERRVELEAQLREALAQRQFDVVYQPIFSLGDNRPLGAEALLRWNHPTRGVVGPSEFIPILETTGMIIDVGMFVLEEACARLRRWRDLNPAFSVSVNVSGRQFEHTSFIEDVHDRLARCGIPPEALVLEITETALMRDFQFAASRLRSLRSTGVRISIDDFGTGYCSLAYLQEFQVDVLKIDRAFVSRMDLSPRGANIVRTIIQLGQDLQLHTIAEGIESQAQLRRLAGYGCDAGQGFLLAVPAAPEATDSLLRRPQPVL